MTTSNELRALLERVEGGEEIGAPRIFYRLTNTEDPEERLEDAALWKALHDEYGSEIGLLAEGDDINIRRTFGRRKSHEWFAQPIDSDVQYWTDPAFLSRARRSFALCDLDEADAEVKRLHAEGKGAFFKSVFTKHLTMPLPVGTDMRDQLDAMVYSFCDRGRCIMIQELCEMEFEHRFFVIGREIVTHSPIQWALTPIDRLPRGCVAKTPRCAPIVHAEVWNSLFSFAAEACAALRTEHCSLDVAMINGAPGIVELNAMHLGQLGLYAADVRALAKASRALLRAKLAQEDGNA